MAVVTLRSGRYIHFTLTSRRLYDLPLFTYNPSGSDQGWYYHVTSRPGRTGAIFEHWRRTLREKRCWSRSLHCTETIPIDTRWRFMAHVYRNGGSAHRRVLNKTLTHLLKASPYVSIHWALNKYKYYKHFFFWRKYVTYRHAVWSVFLHTKT